MSRRPHESLPLLHDLLPPPKTAVVVECPFREAQDEHDWLRTQLSIARRTEDFFDWQRLALCAPRDSIYCRLCHRCLRRNTERHPDDKRLARCRAVVNVC